MTVEHSPNESQSGEPTGAVPSSHNEVASADEHTSSEPRLAGFRVVSGLTFLSRILGLLRDAGMAALFGNGAILDAFSVAFRLPNLARRLFGEGAVTAAFLPHFVRERTRTSPEAAWELGRRVFLVLAVVLATLVLFGEGLLGGIALLTGSPITDGTTSDADLLIELTAILLPYAILICLAAHCGSMLHAHGRFFWPAALPVFLNLAWLAVIGFLIMRGTDELSAIRIIAWAVLGIGVLQFLLPLPLLQRLGFRWRNSGASPSVRVRDVSLTLVPILIGLSITQLNTLLDSLFAWGLSQREIVNQIPGFADREFEQGTASALYFGQRLYQFPLGVFGVALGTVLFPRFARHAEEGNEVALREDLSIGIRLVMAIGLPASVGLMLIAEPVTRLLFERGAFDATDTAQTSAAIVAYCSGVWAYCGLLIVQRGFYAVDDRRTPLTVGLWCVLLNVILNVALIFPLGGVGLAWASAITSGLQMVWLSALLGQTVGGLSLRPILISVLKSLFASVVMGGAVWLTLQAFDPSPSFVGRTIHVAIPIAVGVSTFGVFAIGLRLRVLNELRGRS